jgi:hypothetical protein
MTSKQLEDYKRILAGVRGLKGEYGTGLTRLEAFYWNIHRGKFANRVLNENLNRGKKDALIEHEKEMNAIKQKAIEDSTDSDNDDIRFREKVEDAESFGEQDYHQEIQDHYEQKWAYVNLTREQKQVLESMGINPRMYDSLSLEEKEVLHQCRM